MDDQSKPAYFSVGVLSGARKAGSSWFFSVNVSFAPASVDSWLSKLASQQNHGLNTEILDRRTTSYNTIANSKLVIIYANFLQSRKNRQGKHQKDKSERSTGGTATSEVPLYDSAICHSNS